MGTTAVLALHHGRQGLRRQPRRQPAYLIRGERVDQLTVEHSWPRPRRLRALTAEEARSSRDQPRPA